jgi:glycosyltransferase involved in cell wall biosynthesis
LIENNNTENMTKQSVSVIIPSTCETRRQASLFRAIDSVQSQECINAKILVIVNGDRVDSHLFERLKAAEGLEVHRLSEGSYPLAVRYGRSVVTTDYFSYLDDDDEYLPGALKVRVTPMIAEPQIDFVATNGYRSLNDVDQLALDETSDIEKDPLGSLLRRNWLASCGGLFRTTRVTLDYFNPDVRASEWTYLAFRLSQSLRMKFVNVPTFRIHDSPQSLSKSLKWVTENELKTIEKMISLKPKASLLSILLKHRSDALHGLADIHRKLGNYSLAWRFHLSSLRASGWSHLWFTRKLLLPSLRRDARESSGE